MKYGVVLRMPLRAEQPMLTFNRRSSMLRQLPLRIDIQFRHSGSMVENRNKKEVPSSRRDFPFPLSQRN